MAFAKTSRIRHASVALVAALGAQAALAGDMPDVRVHMDMLPAGKVRQFAEARRDWVAFVREGKRADPWWGTFLELHGRGFLSLRPFKSLAELERSSAQAPKDDAYRAAVDRYTRESDEALVFPHTTQVWTALPELSFYPDQDAASVFGPCSGSWTFDTVAPMRDEDAYVESWEKVHDALRRVHYPLTHLMWRTRFGDGRMMSGWLAATPAEFAQAPSIDKALVEALGPDDAARLLDTLRRSVTASESYPLTCRPELSTARSD
jgi:hypothetical protein